VSNSYGDGNSNTVLIIRTLGVSQMGVDVAKLALNGALVLDATRPKATTLRLKRECTKDLNSSSMHCLAHLISQVVVAS